MKVVLEVKSPSAKGLREEVFDHLPILIGRSKICDLIIDDALASRQHCVLESIEGGSIRLVDLQSANGTNVQGKRIEKVNLSVGDSFMIGDTEISVEKFVKAVEESTVHDLTPIEERVAPETSGTRLKKEEKKPEASPASDELSLKTPHVFHASSARPHGKTKDWVQVSLFWKSELLDIRCFERGDVVQIGSSFENDFKMDVNSIPDKFQLLKILPQGVEIHLHPAMTGLVETRQGVQSLDDLRKTARQTGVGLGTFIPFQDRCLIEIGPFSFFIRAVRLHLTETLEAPLVKEPLYSGVLASVAAAFVLFLLFINGLSEAKVEEEELQPVVKLEPPDAPKPKIERIVEPPPAPKPKPKIGKTPSRQARSSGTQGEGARAKGPEGKRGSETGKTNTAGRQVGFQTKKAPPKKAPPKGALGKVSDPSQARRGLRPDQGTGTAKPKPKGTGQQAPSPTPKPKVRVEDQGILGVLGSSGGGGSSSKGGEMEGSGLGGELEGALAGLERGSTADGRGTGGRGAKGREFGGGGSSLDVGGLGTKGKGGGRSGFGLGSSGTKGEAEVSYIAEEVEVRDGLTREEIERVVRAHQNEIRACYEKSLIRSGNSDLSGRLKIEWFVNTAGRATNLKKLTSFGSEAGLYDCVAARIQSWQFPRPRGGLGAQVSWPFVFRKGG